MISCLHTTFSTRKRMYLQSILKYVDLGRAEGASVSDLRPARSRLDNSPLFSVHLKLTCPTDIMSMETQRLSIEKVSHHIRNYVDP